MLSTLGWGLFSRTSVPVDRLNRDFQTPMISQFSPLVGSLSLAHGQFTLCFQPLLLTQLASSRMKASRMSRSRIGEAFQTPLPWRSDPIVAKIANNGINTKATNAPMAIHSLRSAQIDQALLVLKHHGHPIALSTLQVFSPCASEHPLRTNRVKFEGGGGSRCAVVHNPILRQPRDSSLVQSIPQYSH